MKYFLIVLVAAAVLIATFQAYLTNSGRNDNIDAVVAGRKLDACAEIGAAASDFVFRAQAAQASFSEDTYRAASDGPRALAKASYMAAYLLPQDAAEDSALMRDLSQRIVAALAQRDDDRVAGLMQQFDEANLRVQESCRLVIQGSRFSP